MISSNRNYLLRITLFSTFLFSCLHAMSIGLEAVDDGEGGFYLTLDDQATGTAFATEINYDLVNKNPSTTIDFNAPPGSESAARIGYYLSVHVDKEKSVNGRHDIVFVKRVDTSTSSTPRLLVTHQRSSDSYIESIEVKWSDKSPSGGSLCIHGRMSQYPRNLSKFSDYFGAEDLLNAVLTPPNDVSEITVYYPETPVRYIAITSADEDNTITRVEYIKLHIVPYEPEAPTEVVIKPESSFSMPWNSNGNYLDHTLKIGNSIEENYDAEVSELGLKFYLKPKFDIHPAPYIQPGDKPEDHGMTGYDWWLYSIFLQNPDQAFDGYWNMEENDLWDSENGQLECLYKDGVINLGTPCSGLYEITAVSTLGKKIRVKPVEINLWYNTINTYPWISERHPEIGDDLTSISLNSVPLSYMDSGDYGFYYPMEEDSYGKPFNPKEVNLFVPGFYDGEIYYKIEYSKSISSSGTALGVKKHQDSYEPLEGYNLYTEDSKPNLENLTVDNPATLHIKISKNGSLTPDINEGNSENKFTIQLTDGANRPTPTNIKTVSDSCEPETTVEFYNLNGTRINPDRVSSGLYIMRKGSQTKKVLIP